MAARDMGGRTRVADPLRISGIWWPPDRPGPRFWHGGCFDWPVWGRSMSFRPFTSESYSEEARPEAWRAGPPAHTGQPTAPRRSAGGVVRARLTAGSKAVSALPHLAGEMPIMLLP